MDVRAVLHYRRPVPIASAVALTALLVAAPVQAEPTVRRVCIQMGVPTYSAPDRKARIARTRTGPPSRLGGGEYVQLTGARAAGYQQVVTRERATLWIPDPDPGSGRSPLCLPPFSIMRVCPGGGATPDVPVRERFDEPTAAPIASLRRGGLVRVFEYFEDRGRWAFVEAGGRAGFVPSRDLCLDATAPPGPRATEHFGMIAAPAREECYQSNRERGASEIRRIVIHNSENTMKSAIATFQDCDPAHPTSAHVGIDREGRMYRFVEDRFAAFHTGASHGGFNAVSLGIELVAAAPPELRYMTPQQERALVALIGFWTAEYHITLPERVLANSARAKGYHDLEYWEAPVTIHRLVSATRGTDCPTFVWPDSADGDEAFFGWRRHALRELGRADPTRAAGPRPAASGPP